MSELRVVEDPTQDGYSGLAFVSIFSSKRPTADRGLAVVDVSEYVDAEGRREAEAAEMGVLSFLRNESPPRRWWT